MGRPKGGKNTSHSKEEKLRLVKRNLSGETALENRRKPGNPLAKYINKKELTEVEQLEYKIALLERELLKKDNEIVKLKNSNARERGDAKR